MLTAPNLLSAFRIAAAPLGLPSRVLVGPWLPGGPNWRADWNPD